jgi:pilus assembly protein CpaB
MVSRQWIVFGVATACALAAGLGAHGYLKERVAAIEASQPHSKMVKLVVANEDMAKGARLTADTVSQRSVPEEWVHADALRPEQLDRFTNAELETTARRGQPILWAQLVRPRTASFSNRISPGRRAVTIPVDDVSSASGMIVPGDRIDLVATLKQNGKPRLILLMQKATVLATGKQSAGYSGPDRTRADDGDRRTYTTITLDASPQNARKILALRQIGELTAVLRAPQDEDDAGGPAANAADLLAGDRSGKTLHSVRIVYGNELHRTPLMGLAAGFSR